MTEPFININNPNFTTYDHIELIEGTYPPTENNKTDLIISENLSKEGNHQVGDDFKIIYGRTPMIFKVGGIYKPISDEVSDYIILGGMQGFHEKYNNNFGSKYTLWSNFSATFDSPEEAESSVEAINQILQENDRTQNLKLVNREVQYESFIAGLNQYKTISVAVILIVIITTVILIVFVFNRDIKHTEDDLFSTMFEDDKQIKRRSNLFIILISSIFSLSVSYFTAPALNNTFTTSLVLDKMTYGEEEFPNPFENKKILLSFIK